MPGAALNEHARPREKGKRPFIPYCSLQKMKQRNQLVEARGEVQGTQGAKEERRTNGVLQREKQ